MNITVKEAIAEATAQKKEKVTFEKFGEALGVSKQYVSQIQNKVLTNNQIKLLENSLNIDLTNVNKNKDDIILDYFPDVCGSCGNGVFQFSTKREQIAFPKNAI